MIFKMTPPTRKLLNTAQRRFVRARSGSVLILVVALLVMMALIGTAFMTMAQYDRGSAAQHNFNTEADLLLDGAISLARGTVITDLYQSGSYRPMPTATYRPTTGVGGDGLAVAMVASNGDPANPGTPFLADRLPSTDALAGRVPANIVSSLGPYWRFVTSPLIGSQYETPYWPIGVNYGSYFRDLPPPGSYPQGVVPIMPPVSNSGAGFNARWAPTVVILNGIQYPALQALDQTGSPIPGTPPILAADTDGDGIADAHFVKMMTIDGITYYAAFRIVDNAAAFNVNTAWQANNYPATGSNPLGDIFPTNVNLLSWLAGPTTASADTITYLNGHRFGLTPANALKSTATSFITPPYQDYNTQARSDFFYAGGGNYDALWMQLGRRPDNPGLVAVGASPSTSLQALPATEGINLAERFCLRDPSSSLYPSLLESLLPYSMGVSTASASPYAANDSWNWYNNNFAYVVPTNAQPNKLPLRSILTTKNPVSGFVPNPFNILPVASATGSGSTFGDIVPVTTTAGSPNNNILSTRAYAFIGPTGTSYRLTAPSGALGISGGTQAPAFRWYYVPMPWSTAPTKISAQTGTFGQLMLAYWAVMSDKTNPNGSGVPAGTETHQFYSPLRNPYEQDVVSANTTSRPVPPAGGKPAGQTFLLPSEVIKLRAALAAVNTIDMRDPDYNVTSERILLTGTVNGTPQLVEATVYGNEAQPYITRVYFEDDNATAGQTSTGKGGGGPGTPQPNPQGYVGIELYNPYPFDINISSWNLGVLQGRVANGSTTPTYPDMKLVPITGMTSTGLTAKPTTNINTTIPQHSYLVLENYNSSGAPGSAKDATYRPKVIDSAGVGQNNNVTYCYVSNLSEVIQDPANTTGQPGGEFVLLRPRQATMTVTNTTKSLSCPGLVTNSEYDETKLYDLVPIDSFDFTGLKLQAKGVTGPFNGYYYARPSGTGNDWKFVYPGRWNPKYTPARQEGVVTWTWNPPATDNTKPPTTVAKFGSVTSTTQYASNFPPIQLNNFGFAGPFSSSVGKPQYPFGGFTRNLDILEAPFIGSYRLRRVSAPPNGVALSYTNSDLSWLLELNPVTLDSQQADDYDEANPQGSDDKYENIGRFCPIDGRDTNPNALNGPNQTNANDFAPAFPPKYTPSPQWRYHWAMKLQDYLTVESPQDEQFPLMDASFASSGTPPQGVVHNSSGNTPAPQSYGQVATASGFGSMTAVVDLNPAANYVGLPIQFLSGGAMGQISMIATATFNGGTTTPTWTLTFNPGLRSMPAQYDQFVILGPPEETASLNGLVNVNTAPWPVLAGVPMIPNGGMYTDALSGFQRNVSIAQSIVYYRDINDSTGINPPHGHGPFQNLFELNDVPIYSIIPPGGAAPLFRFRDAMGNSQTTSFNSTQGNYTSAPGSNPIVGDFQGTFLMANRVSDLLTTHSDSFTAYIEIQGWQNAETASPVLKVTRRAAILIDRTAVTPKNRSPNTTNVPMN